MTLAAKRRGTDQAAAFGFENTLAKPELSMEKQRKSALADSTKCCLTILKS